MMLEHNGRVWFRLFGAPLHPGDQWGHPTRTLTDAPVPGPAVASHAPVPCVPDQESDPDADWFWRPIDAPTPAGDPG